MANHAHKQIGNSSKPYGSSLDAPWFICYKPDIISKNSRYTSNIVLNTFDLIGHDRQRHPRGLETKK